MDTLVKYYEAWLDKESPQEPLRMDLGPMKPIANGEFVCPPGALMKAHSAAITTMISECEEKAVEVAVAASHCSQTVCRV